MDSEVFNTLIAILESRAFEFELRAIADRRNSEAGEFPNYEIKAGNHVRQADEIYYAINLLKSFREQKTPFEIATPVPDAPHELKPTKK